MKSKAAVFLILCGVLLMFYGITVGEAETVFHKAIIVCLECIGIG